MMMNEYVTHTKTGEPLIFCECVPQKAARCMKYESFTKGGKCDLTVHKEFAKDATKPFRMRRIKSDVVIFERDYINVRA